MVLIKEQAAAGETLFHLCEFAADSLTTHKQEVAFRQSADNLITTSGFVNEEDRKCSLAAENCRNTVR